MGVNEKLPNPARVKLQKRPDAYIGSVSSWFAFGHWESFVFMLCFFTLNKLKRHNSFLKGHSTLGHCLVFERRRLRHGLAGPGHHRAGPAAEAFGLPSGAPCTCGGGGEVSLFFLVCVCVFSDGMDTSVCFNFG